MKPEYKSKIIKHRLYWEIIKGRRAHVGNRWLAHLWPKPNEVKKTFLPKYAYLNYIGPADAAGNHYHKNKKEFFCPMGRLDLILKDLKTGRIEKVKMSLGTRNKYVIYYIPPLVAHAVVNRTKTFQPLVVLTNKVDLYGNTIKEKVI